MRFLRISLLLNTFLNKSNKSKFLKYINIGIFFSVFAISSALITFYIENKIDNLEHTLSETHIEQKEIKQEIDEYVQMKVLLKSIVVTDKAITDLYEFTASTKLGQYLITVDDFYLPKSRTKAMKLLGNSVAVDAVYHVGNHIVEYLNDKETFVVKDIYGMKIGNT